MGARDGAPSAAPLTPTPDEQGWFNIFRLGVWPDFFPGVQFSRDPEALNQYFRQMTPNTGPFDIEVTSDAVAALFEKIGPGILVTHSQGGGPGWRTAIKSQNVRAIVAYEPGSNFMFPEGEVPPPMPSAGGTLEAVGVPLSEFMRLTKMPIIIFYGDYIPEKPMANPGQDQWRVRLDMARLWADAVNRRGGDVTVVHLPRGRHPREHALPLLGSQQFGSSGPPVPIPGQEGLGLTCGANSRSGQLEQTSSARWHGGYGIVGPIHGPSQLSDDVSVRFPG